MTGHAAHLFGWCAVPDGVANGCMSYAVRGLVAVNTCHPEVLLHDVPKCVCVPFWFTFLDTRHIWTVLVLPAAYIQHSEFGYNRRYRAHGAAVSAGDS